MKGNIFTLIFLFFIHQISFSQDNTIVGDFWIDVGDDNLYNGEDGFSNVKVYLISVDSSEVVDSTFTINSKFSFPSSSSFIIPSGTYYIEIEDKEFIPGGLLNGVYSCLGYNDADDGVDFDDNGQDLLPIQTSNFYLESGLVEYIDICLTVPCGQENPLASESCGAIDDLDVICDINTLGSFCAYMPSTVSAGNQPSSLCPSGGEAENISWFAFQAYDGNYSIVVSPTYCMGSTNGSEGIQVGLYTDCSFTETVFCEPNCSTGQVTIASDLLVPGAIYYLYIDGCYGSVCSYDVDINGTPFPFNIEVDELCVTNDETSICDDSDFLVGENLLFFAQNPILNYNYSWSITTISGEPYGGDTSPSTNDSNLELTFENEGVYTICISEILNTCNYWSGQECRTVNITNTVGLSKNDIKNINVSPNPTFDYLNIDMGVHFSNATFSIHSIDGVTVLSGNLENSSKINVRDLAAGLYIIGLFNHEGENIFVSRFVKG